MTAITVQQLRKEFSSIIAVDGFDLEIQDGEFVTIVGPSGCGKTTTLRLLAGLELATDGSIKFGGRDVTNAVPAERNVGMVFQNLALYPHMSVRENMAFGLRVVDVPESEHDRRIQETARMLDIEELLDRPPGELSGGQQQRVAIGRTLVLEPDVFLLDEPLASLDAKLKAEIRTELLELHQRVGITTIYVTHDQHQAMTMSDRIVVMNDGQIQQFDTPEAVYQDPNNMFVADFVGTPSINFFDCDVTVTGETVDVDFGFHTLALGGAVAAERTGTVKAAIRPEHVQLHTDEGFDAKVRFVEPTGKEQIVHLIADGHEFTAVVSEGIEVSPQTTVTVSFIPERTYLFDPETTERLFG